MFLTHPGYPEPERAIGRADIRDREVFMPDWLVVVIIGACFIVSIYAMGRRSS
jgi:hypothetical protein